VTTAPPLAIHARWPQPESLHRVHALTTTRHALAGSDVSAKLAGRDPRDAAEVARHRRSLTRLLGLPSEPVWLRQVHGSAVWPVEPDARRISSVPGGEPEADASITRASGVVLAVLTADCLPIALACDDARGIGVVHAGWRGLAAGVIEAAVARLRSAPQQVQAWLGPAISGPVYEVGDEVRAAFVDRQVSDATAFAATRPGHWTCDLYALARARLARLGITRVGGGEHCTLREPHLFHSYRRDGADSGRMVTLAWIEQR
jgi:hypothetical protein